MPKPDTVRIGWRPMTAGDIALVLSIANAVHQAYPEDEATFAERQRLYPAGCRVLDMGGEAAAYVIAHPWHYLKPPALNTLLGELPAPATTFYIHDIALLPQARGSGQASAILGELLGQARAAGHSNASLVAVGGTENFWARQGFTALSVPALEDKLASYDRDARYMVRDLSTLTP